MFGLGFIGCLLLASGASYLILGRFLFRSRSKPWEQFEDMMNEGCQTTLLLLASGVIGGVSATILFVWWLRN